MTDTATSDQFPGGSLLFAVPRQMHAVYESTTVFHPACGEYHEPDHCPHACRECGHLGCDGSCIAWVHCAGDDVPDDEHPFSDKALNRVPVGAAVYEALPPDEPTLYYSLVSPDAITESRERIRVATGLMKGLSRSINAWACDDQFGQPNAADIAAEELELALEALAGGQS